MTNKSGSVYPVDRSLAQQHLGYLGYKPGENVYFRFFYHSSDSRKTNDAGRKASQLDWDAIEQYQQEGRGVYVVVNGSGGGHSDGEIKECCAIFCEWDDLPLSEQSLKWQELGFVEPTFTVYSGDKSMQPYWVFEEPIAVEQWRELQELLISVMSADKSNKNPSRVFRLAGGWHIKPGREPVLSNIAQDSGIRYSYGELCDRLLSLQPELSLQPSLSLETAPLQQKPVLPIQEKPQRYKDVTVPVPAIVSLTCALGKPKEFLSGVATLRNTSMTALARDLIGTANEFARLGQTTIDDAYTLFIDACRRCSSGAGWNEREWEQIWKSAMRSNPSASKNHAAPDAVENSIRGEYWRSISNHNGKKSGEDTGGDFSQLTDDEAGSKLLRDYRRLCSVFGNRIRLNTLTKRIEIDNNPIALDRAKLQLAIKHNVVLKSGREDVQDMMAELAENNQYSPVAEYLLSLPKPADTSILDSIAPRYLGVSEPIYSSMVRKTLIAAAARALEPGCKVDTALILQSPQGWQKSQF